MKKKIMMAMAALAVLVLATVAVACEDELAEGEYRPGVERPDIPGGYQPRDTVADTTAHQEDTTHHGGIDYSQYDPIPRYADSTLNAWLDSVIELVSMRNLFNSHATTIMIINDSATFAEMTGVEPIFDFEEVSVLFGIIQTYNVPYYVTSQNLYLIEGEYDYHVSLLVPSSLYASFGSVRVGGLYPLFQNNTSIKLTYEFWDEH